MRGMCRRWKGEFGWQLAACGKGIHCGDRGKGCGKDSPRRHGGTEKKHSPQGRN
jgi:hypothetical protein